MEEKKENTNGYIVIRRAWRDVDEEELGKEGEASGKPDEISCEHFATLHDADTSISESMVELARDYHYAFDIFDIDRILTGAKPSTALCAARDIFTGEDADEIENALGVANEAHRINDAVKMRLGAANGDEDVMGTANEAYLDAASDEDEEAVREEVRNREDEYGKETRESAGKGEMKANGSGMNEEKAETAKYAVLWHGRDAHGRIFHHISHTYGMLSDAREHAMRDYALAKHGVALTDDESWRTFKQEHALELNLLDLDLCRDMKTNYEEGGELGEIAILKIGD